MARDGLLTDISVFRELDRDLLKELTALVRLRQFAPRETVVQQGGPGDGLFIIHTGYLKVTLSGPTGTSSTLGIMGPGEMFGELSLLDGGARSATVSAITRCDLGAIERQSFLWLFENRPNLGIALMEVVARRLRRLSERSEDLATLPVPTRLAKQLLHLADAHAIRLSHGRIRLAVPLSQRELGELVGATRESVNKTLRKWMQQGALDEESGYLIITDLDKLRRVASA
jgi:CRP/FNR family transcriptional regulator, cyclic AMP receptor protein